MKYKVGDKVLIKSADWYYKNRDEVNLVDCGSASFVPSMVKFCGQIVTISSVSSEKSLLGIYRIKEDGGAFNWTDEMIEGIFAEENKPLTFGDSWECPQGYQFVDENGNVINAQKIALEKKKKEYPKTYEECCKALNWNHRDYDRVGYESELLCKFQVLLLCRDAYWKIAGEEMGLGKPWEYDCNSEDFTPAIIYRSGCIQKVEIQYRNAILTFPTIEMRDAFYENFKDLIEICKELL